MVGSVESVGEGGGVVEGDDGEAERLGEGERGERVEGGVVRRDQPGIFRVDWELLECSDGGGYEEEEGVERGEQVGLTVPAFDGRFRGIRRELKRRRQGSVSSTSSSSSSLAPSSLSPLNRKGRTYPTHIHHPLLDRPKHDPNLLSQQPRTPSLRQPQPPHQRRPVPLHRREEDEVDGRSVQGGESKVEFEVFREEESEEFPLAHSVEKGK